MVRSESADEEIVIDKFDDDMDGMDDDRWNDQGNHAEQRLDGRAGSSLSPSSASADPDRRLRRQIANCNERRRMQSINAGFQSLRALLPRKDGEKLSKAAILQQTADLIRQLQNDRTRLLMEKEGPGVKKAKMEETYWYLDNEVSEVDHRSLIDRLQSALERERTSRMYLEQQLNQMRDLYQMQSSISPTGSPVALTASTVTTTAPTMSASVTSSLMPSPHLQSSVVVSQETSVIRPTPLPPISVDVSPRATMPSHASSPFVSLSAVTPITESPLSSMTTASAFTSSLAANRSLQTILDAIRHLEGGGMVSSPPTPTSQAQMVR